MMEKNYKILVHCEVLIVILLFYSEFGECAECSGLLNGQYVKESCAVGGCCVPSDGNGSTLCCIPTLTLILVSVFVGGTILVIIIVIVCCLVCRYRKKKKLRRRLEERRRRQRERDAERQRRLMMDPFVNGDPFQAPVEGGNAQPPHYHGQESDEQQSENITSPRRPVRTQRNDDTRIPPPYPNTPPPAYYSRIGTRQENRARSRFTNNRAVSRSTSNEARTNSRVETRTEYTTEDIETEVTTEDTPLPRTPSPGPPTRRSNNLSRINTNISSAVALMNNINSQRQSRNENQRNVISIEDLEESEKDDKLGRIAEIKPESRLSTKFSFHNTETDRQTAVQELRTPVSFDSRKSTKNDSRTPKIESRQSTKTDSTRVMNSIFNHEQPLMPRDNRGRFIKSSISTVSEDVERVGTSTSSNSRSRNYVRAVERDEPIVNNLDFV